MNDLPPELQAALPKEPGWTLSLSGFHNGVAIHVSALDATRSTRYGETCLLSELDLQAGNEAVAVVVRALVESVRAARAAGEKRA